MKIAFTGSHGVGKTTSVFEKARDLKIFYPNKNLTILTENARHSPLPINKKTSEESQLWIFTSQIQKEIYLQNQYDILICDRTICDAIAYTKVAGFYSLYKSMISLAKEFMNSYDEIYFKYVRNNNYLFSDGTRDSEDVHFRQAIEDALIDVYKEIGMYSKIKIS